MSATSSDETLNSYIERYNLDNIDSIDIFGDESFNIYYIAIQNFVKNTEISDLIKLICKNTENATYTFLVRSLCVNDEKLNEIIEYVKNNKLGNEQLTCLKNLGLKKIQWVQ